jgi:hypothetical protein
MKASKSLSKPTNWQDFETLCKKLWGEIWADPHIKKNGRLGQEQSGVDIVGMPLGENEYYGIQCKGKDDYINSKLTKTEIESEIEKAKLFKPRLKYLYFATTANKDVKIEEFIREKNVEHKKNKLFGIVLFSWEDIVDLIHENKHTSDFYIKSINYQSNNNAFVSFDNDETTMVLIPEFVIKRAIYSKKTPIHPELKRNIGNMHNMFTLSQALFEKSNNKVKVNKSICPVRLKITNTGIDPIEEYKLVFNVVGNVRKVSKNRVKNDFEIFSIQSLKIDEKNISGVYSTEKMLVSKDNYTLQSFYIHFHNEENEVKILWKLYSKNYYSEGDLTIQVKPNIRIERNRETVDDVNDERTIDLPIEDYFSEE